MKKKNIIALVVTLTLILTACKKEEHYESKNLPIESVFDSVSSEQEGENNEKENNDNSETPQDNKQENNDNNDNKNENSDNSEDNVEETFVAPNIINIRSTPEFGDNIVKQIDPGTEIKITEKYIGKDNNWAKIVYEDKVYYISMDLLN